jgi:hypothetical protein
MEQKLKILKMEKEKILIELEDWTHECGDKCCFTYGTDIFVNGEKIENDAATSVEQALSAVLIHLGYDVEIGYK